MDNNISTSHSQRVDYIDALKGFLILSVVMCHVAGFCIGIQDDTPSFLPILFEFRNPPFFFISGYFAYKIGSNWNAHILIEAIKKKSIAIAWPTFVFLLALLHVHPSHNGHSFLHDDITDLWFHWFTLSLFVFFCFYYIAVYCLRFIKYEIVKSVIFLTIGIASYLLFSVQSVYLRLPIASSTKDVLGMTYWGFFLFFILGVLTKKHAHLWHSLLENKYCIAVCILLFFLFNLYSQPLQEKHFNLFRLTTYLTGIVLVISFFKNYTPQGLLKRISVFTGRRTLDIYLIHYFFLPLGLYDCLSLFRETPMPIIEFFVTLSISLVIIALSLLTSYIIRLSPLTALLILGDNRIQNKKT